MVAFAADIELHEGKVGSGKTYCAVMESLRYLAAGRCVVSNIVYDVPAVERELWRQYRWKLRPGQIIHVEKPEDVQAIYKLTPPGDPDRGRSNLVIIDEAHLYFNARRWQKLSEEFEWFLSQCRKVGVNVWFIAQVGKTVDMHLRAQCTRIFRYKRLKGVRIPKTLIKYPFDHILRIEVDYDGKSVQEREFITKSGRVFACYRTAQLLRTFPMAESPEFAEGEAAKSQRLAVVKLWAIRVGVTVVSCMIIAGVGFFLRDLYRKGFVSAKRAKESVTEAGKKIEGGFKRSTSNAVVVVRPWRVGAVALPYAMQLENGAGYRYAYADGTVARPGAESSGFVCQLVRREGSVWTSPDTQAVVFVNLPGSDSLTGSVTTVLSAREGRAPWLTVSGTPESVVGLYLLAEASRGAASGPPPDVVADGVYTFPQSNVVGALSAAAAEASRYQARQVKQPARPAYSAPVSFGPAGAGSFSGGLVRAVSTPAPAVVARPRM